MKGNNVIYINQATVIEAVECWLATQLKVTVKVNAVVAKSSGSSLSDGFELRISAVDDAPGENQ